METKKNISQIVLDLVKRAEECKRDGKHRNSHYYPWDSANSNNMIVRKGICGYCLTSIERYLTREEQEAHERFRKSLDEPFMART